MELVREQNDTSLKRLKNKMSKDISCSNNSDKDSLLDTSNSFTSLSDTDDPLDTPNNCAESVEKFAKYVWNSMSHHELPEWLSDNEFLLNGHRPEMPSFYACFTTWFRIHTETGNIWTHLIGAIIFFLISLYTFMQPSIEKQFQEKFILSFFFVGAIVCLCFSTLYHTFSCHSHKVSVLWKKLDYCGISILTVGSFVPWLYYAFYCDTFFRISYLILIAFLGSACIAVSLMEKFGTADYRSLRAGMFIALGLSAIFPASHYISIIGWFKAYNVGKLCYLLAMAFLYIAGACIYAARIPERFFPGKCDIWFQSHQIFHVCVVAAAYVHYVGINKLSNYRNSLGDCSTNHVNSDFSFEF